MVLSGKKVLLAEDNPTNQMVAMQMLESLGAEVTLAVDGAEALEIMETRIFDVALIDIEMPRVSGIELIRRLRASDGPLAEMPLVALTAYVMREHRAAIDEAGADGIIAKPILSIDQFGEEIDGYIQARAAIAGTAAHAVTGVGGRPGTVAGIDHDTFDRLRASFDGPGRLELMSRICSDIGSARDRVGDCITSHDHEELRAATHILISVAGAVGATRLQELAQCLNSAGHASDSAAIDRDAPDLVTEANLVLDFVRGSLEE